MTQPNHLKTPWTPALIDDLMRWWAEGLSATVIARRFQTTHHVSISRNAGLGKVHRLGIEERGSPIKRVVA